METMLNLRSVFSFILCNIYDSIIITSNNSKLYTCLCKTPDQNKTKTKNKTKQTKTPKPNKNEKKTNKQEKNKTKQNNIAKILKAPRFVPQYGR